jgi:hypothetical protein
MPTPQSQLFIVNTYLSFSHSEETNDDDDEYGTRKQKKFDAFHSSSKFLPDCKTTYPKALLANLVY